MVFNCEVCFKHNLPPLRVHPSRYFLHCTKGQTPKIYKAWFALFVCLLSELLQLVLSQLLKETKSCLARDVVQWHFLPPSAPHFGGLGESSVRPIELHLRWVIGSSFITLEVLAQIESLLNHCAVCQTANWIQASLILVFLNPHYWSKILSVGTI